MVIRFPAYGRPGDELPSVEQVITFDTLKRGDPVVAGGAGGLGRRVRWVHVSEILGIADLLHGGEMLLTTGLVLPDDDAQLAAYVDRLADANAAALVIGLGPRFRETLPAALIEAADRRDLPLIALRRTIAFIDVTEEVHASLVDMQIRELQASESIHVVFTALAMQGSKPAIVLKQVAKLSGFAVILENRSNQILAFDPADRAEGDVLAEWAEHTRRPTRSTTRTFYDPQTGWLQTTVGARGNVWGRLILLAAAAGARDAENLLDPMTTIPHSLIMLVEQAAATLAIGRLVDRESELLDLNTHRSILNALLSGDDVGRDLEQGAEALGVSFRRSDLVALAVRDRAPDETDLRERRRSLRGMVTALSDLARESGPTALIGLIDDEFTVGVLAPADGDAAGLAHRTVDRLKGRGFRPLVSVAGPGRGLESARTMLAEAVEVAAIAAGMGVEEEVVSSGDLGVRGLIYSLRDDPRVQQFSARTIGPLLEHDAAHGTNLVGLLRHYLQAGRNKTVAARNAYVSRPWMHERLHMIGDVLGVDLDDEETCISLQVALLAADAARSAAAPPGGRSKGRPARQGRDGRAGR